MQLGFFGLGHLGLTIAGKLKAYGHTLTVWNRASGKGGRPVGRNRCPAVENRKNHND